VHVNGLNISAWSVIKFSVAQPDDTFPRAISDAAWKTDTCSEFAANIYKSTNATCFGTQWTGTDGHTFITSVGWKADFYILIPLSFSSFSECFPNLPGLLNPGRQFQKFLRFVCVGTSSHNFFARFEVFMAVNIQVEVFWVVTPCNVAVGYRRFGIPALPPSSRWSDWRHAPLKRWHPTATLRGVRTQNASIWIPIQAQITSSWRWRQHDPPKRWYPTTTPHGVTTQKTSNWIFFSFFF
jgi:hypothetical protein